MDFNFDQKKDGIRHQMLIPLGNHKRPTPYSSYGQSQAWGLLRRLAIVHHKTILQVSALLVISLFFFNSSDKDHLEFNIEGEELLDFYEEESGLGFSSSVSNQVKGKGKLAPKPVYGTGEQSEFAPANPDKLSGGDIGRYIHKYKHLAISEMRRTGIPASITLAQGIIESRSGSSRLARQLNNHFGIKCFSKSCKKGHCHNFTDDHHKDFFRNFKTVDQSFIEHSKVVLLPRYANKAKKSKDYKHWAWALQNGGYATGRQYANKLIKIIERHRLYLYDDQPSIFRFASNM